MKTTRVVFKIGAPIVLTQFAPNLDAIAYEALTQATMLNHDDIISELKKVILWNDDLGLFHASAMRFVVTPDQGVVRKNYVRVDTQTNLFKSENFSPNSSNGKKYASVTTAGGAFKKRVTERLAYSTSMVCFDTVCDREKLRKLLMNNFIGVGYDAFSSGMGEITSIEFIDIDEDVSILCNGTARRNIPVSTGGDINGEVATTPFTPPYYLQENATKCYTAERFSVIALQNITKAI